MAKTKAVSAKDDSTFLRDALLSVEEKFRSDLKHENRVNSHNGSHGDGTEDAWLKLLKDYLPARYKVARAFAVDHKGNTTKQLDCLVYDAHFTPKLFGADRRLYVPAEAVYATFEIKQIVNAAYLKEAAEKVESLRKLTRTSASLMGASGPNPARVPPYITGGLLAMKASWTDGLGSTFLSNFTNYTGESKLDFILTAESGFCDALDSALSPEIVTGSGALMRGLFRLIKALRHKNTVPAVEWEKYEDVLRN
jgi:hypothetical protein